MQHYDFTVTVEAVDDGFLLRCMVDGHIHREMLFDTFEEAKAGAEDLMNMVTSVTIALGGTVNGEGGTIQ